MNSILKLTLKTVLALTIGFVLAIPSSILFQKLYYSVLFRLNMISVKCPEFALDNFDCSLEYNPLLFILFLLLK